MKILIVQMLRMGDIVLSTPVISGLMKKYPNAEIHFLVNRECQRIFELIPEVAQIHLFDRNELQESIAHSDRSFFEAFNRLDHLIEDLNAENFDLMINLTHNKLSGYLCGEVNATEKLGLNIKGDTVEFGSAWFQFLNEYGSDDGEECFHYADIYYKGSLLEGRTEKFLLSENEEAQKNVLSRFSGIQDLILVQAFTSDVKKNFGVENWLQFARSLHSVYSHGTLVFVGAPNEEPEIEKIVHTLIAEGISAVKYICSIPELYSLLKISRVLVSGDTLTKHMAVAAEVPVIELALGSSKPSQTAAFDQSSIIVQPNVLCSPCGHSEQCFRTFHACAGSIDPYAVALLTVYRMLEDWENIFQLASETQDKMKISTSNLLDGPVWYKVPVQDVFSEKSVAFWISKVSWSLFLNSRDTAGFFEIGTETYKLHRVLSYRYSDIDSTDWKYMYEQLRRIYESCEEQISLCLSELRSIAHKYEEENIANEMSIKLMKIRREFQGFPFMETYLHSLDDILEDNISSSFVRFRRIIEVLKVLRERLIIESKVTKSLVSRVEESHGREI